ncbi:MAG: beta-N-acetylhexosaminidase [Clostridia bacterium]|nr:beta-N-acetylhexosaminidase [Clostridia bacterium]
MKDFKTLGVMLDLSRNAVMTVDALKKFTKLLKRMGYNTLLLYMEDTYFMESDPYIGYLKGRYTPEELREIDEYAASLHMEVIPCIQTLAHLSSVLKWNKYPKDTADILMVDDEKTYELIDRMLGYFKGIFRSKRIHVGMDEARELGRGKHLDAYGYEDKLTLMKKHLARVNALCKKHDLQPMIWSDMIFSANNDGNHILGQCELPREALKVCPKSVIPVHWDYWGKDPDRYRAMLENHRQFSTKTWFAGCIWGWTGVVPHNGYSIEVNKAAIDGCRAEGCRNIFFCLWGDDGAECSHYAKLPALLYLAQYAKGVTDEAVIKDKFKRLIGIDFDDFMLIDTPNYIAGNEREAAAPCDPSKYMLYSDLFNGFLDFTVSEGGNERYADMAEQLRAVARKSRKYGYLFETEACLCDVLAVKYELGVKTRWSYHNKRKWDLLLYGSRDYTYLPALIRRYGEALEKQWMAENKPYGFDVQEIRLAGLIARVESCRRRLLELTDGQLDRIEELECEILPFGGHKKGESILYNTYRDIVTACVFTQ